LFAALILIGIFLIFRRAKAKRLQFTQLDQVRQQLEELRKETTLPAHVTALRISLIIRRYLAHAFEDPVLFETDEEFTLRETALTLLHPDSQRPVTDYLHTLSQIKYAPANSPVDTDQLITDAESLLRNLEINVS